MFTTLENPMRRRFDPSAMKRLRRKLRVSQPQFAELSGIPLDTVRMYEQGRTLPSLERLFIIADTFGCPIDDLCVAGTEG